MSNLKCGQERKEAHQVTPDATTTPATLDRRGPTAEITGLNLQRNTENVPPEAVNGPQVVWLAVLVAENIPDPLINSL